jgi:hypothetical protein
LGGTEALEPDRREGKAGRGLPEKKSLGGGASHGAKEMIGEAVIGVDEGGAGMIIPSMAAKAELRPVGNRRAEARSDLGQIVQASSIEAGTMLAPDVSGEHLGNVKVGAVEVQDGIVHPVHGIQLKAATGELGQEM